MRTILLIITCIAIVSGIIGCGSSEIVINITSTGHTNDNRPFYVAVRSVEENVYVVESYQEVASKLFVTPPDKSILKTEPVYPGIEKELIVEPAPENQKLPLAIYLFLTKPGSDWKQIVRQPLPSSIAIELQGNRVVNLDY